MMKWQKVCCFVDNQRKWRLYDLSIEPASVSLYILDILMSRCDQCLRQIKEECRPVGRHRLFVMSFQKHEGGEIQMEKTMFHPHSPEFHENPFAVLSRFREQDPIHKFELRCFEAPFRLGSSRVMMIVWRF